MRGPRLGAILLTLAAGCGETLVDHGATDLLRPPSNGCDSAAACGPDCVACTAAPAGAVPACVGPAGGEFCDYECQGGFLKCSGGCCPAKAVAAGAAHTCAIAAGAADGTLYCWGENGSGQVTGAAGAAVLAPVKLRIGVTAVALGASHTCAIVSGTVECWGLNTSGQVTPRPAHATPSAIAAGRAHTCALDGGAVRCWGSGDAATAAPIPAGADAISAGADHACALVGTEIRCWGAGALGQLGVEPPPASTTAPVTVAFGGTTVPAAVAAGSNLTCAADTPPNDEDENQVSDALTCWGSGLGARLAADPQPTPASPTRTDGRSIIRSEVGRLAVGRSHVCVKRNGVDQAVHCLGDDLGNEWGQLGGLTPVGAFEDVTVPETTGAVDFAAGADHACAVLLNGALRCWGRNSSGQLGDGTTITPGVDDVRTVGTPVPVSGL